MVTSKAECVFHTAKVIDYPKLQLFSLSARLARLQSFEKRKIISNIAPSLLPMVVVSGVLPWALFA